MAGEGPPSTSLLITAEKDVDADLRRHDDSPAARGSPSRAPGITSRVRPFPTSVVLPAWLPVAGEVLTSHIRSVDTQARPVRYAGATVARETALLVRAKLDTVITI
jgi:mRNA-degrading endonuclease toxin of MazEF toxin-antitoxin module